MDALCDGQVDDIDHRFLLQYHLPGQLLRPGERNQQDFDFVPGRVEVTISVTRPISLLLSLTMLSNEKIETILISALTNLVSYIVQRIPVTCFNTF